MLTRPDISWQSRPTVHVHCDTTSVMANPVMMKQCIPVDGEVMIGSSNIMTVIKAPVAYFSIVLHD